VFDVLAGLFGGVFFSGLRSKILGPDRFDCGVRVISGSLPGEGRRWKHRASRIKGDQLQHGTLATFRLRVRGEIPNPGGWNLVSDCLVYEADELEHGARIQIACMPHASDLVSRLPRSA
jgi:hypothetical protein